MGNPEQTTILDWASYLAMLGLFLIVSFAVCLNALSRIAEPISPNLSLFLNPFNLEARIDWAFSQLTGEKPTEDVDLDTLLINGYRQAPLDARSLSLLGIHSHQQGDTKHARQLFDQSLKLLPTEIQALNHQFAFAVRDGQYATAIDYLEIIGRRWAKNWATIEPFLPALLSDEAALAVVIRRFTEPRMRQLLINSLAKKAETLPLAYRILNDWHAQGVSDLDPWVNRITTQFMRNRRPIEAFLLFKMTRQVEEQGQIGFVYNGKFDRPLSGNPFDWSLAKQSGVDLQIIRRTASPSGSNTDEPESIVSIRFLNSPVRFDNVSQLVRLPPNRYRLQATYSANDLRAPSPLRIAISCHGNRNDLGLALFETGDVQVSTTGFVFQVPPQDCRLQRIHVYNKNLTESWQNRYNGTLFLHSVQISAPGS